MVLVALDRIAPRQHRLKTQLFLLSFAALFLELTLIRWAPSVVFLIAYYANLLLLSSFFGLGIGAMICRRRLRSFRWFLVLLAGNVGLLILCRRIDLSVSASEMRFYSGDPRPLNYVILIGLFVANTLVFIPFGQQIGRLFNLLPRLPAYSWDLAGSLCGTLCFAFFSWCMFSPVLGFAIVIGIFASQRPRKDWFWIVPLGALVLGATLTSSEPGGLWSPYHHIVVTAAPDFNERVTNPPPDLFTMRDPPAYTVNVNGCGYQVSASLDPGSYTPGLPYTEYISGKAAQYNLPYALHPRQGRVLVLGAGCGADVQEALLSGAGRVDAVEIDPGIIQISKGYNAGAPYADPRVTVHIGDARSYVARARPGSYDKVIFGFLDSQALASSMDNIRLDGFVYTVEGIRAAYALLRDDGLLAISFFPWKDWMIPKMYRTIAEATGRPPLVYVRGGSVILCAPRGNGIDPQPLLNGFERVAADSFAEVQIPTDDWPYLYLREKALPGDYLIVIGVLLCLALAAVLFLRGRSFKADDAHFAFLGMGFLLLETKSISDCSLLYGSTWVVTLVVVAGVLLMVLAANLAAARLRRFSFWLYAPLFAALALLLVVPRDLVLTLSLPAKILWTLLVVPLPIFFAGLIFSTTFKSALRPAALLGANLVGGMVGGFSEYLGMAVGSRALSLIVIAAYCGSLLCQARYRRVTWVR
jgi:hypothetical protein